MLRVLEGQMTLQLRGGARERLSYRTLDVEQIGSFYETVVGFTAETARGRVLAIRAGKDNRTPVFLDLDALAAQKGEARIRHLKEAGRSQLSAAQAKAVKEAGTVGRREVRHRLKADERIRAGPCFACFRSGANLT